MTAETSAPIVIDQVLHGYDRGHRELAGSVELDEQARATMLLMSDLLTDESLEDDACYLCCYPLRSMSRHVLSRTWLAGRRYRPGSVWTHSLLLDYPTLARVFDLSALLVFLKRPDDGITAPYQRSIKEPLPLSQNFMTLTEDSASLAVAQLYGDNRRITLVPAGSQQENDNLAMALWRQLWPGQRRDFAFVSAVTGPSSPLVAGCTLRFVRGVFQEVDLNSGQKVLLDDLPRPGPTTLRNFLARYVGESREPRRVAASLASIWKDGLNRTSTAKLAPLAAIARAEGLNRLKKDLITSITNERGDVDTLIEVVREFRADPEEALPNSIVAALGDLTAAQIARIVQVGASAPARSLGRRALRAVVELSNPRLLLSAAGESNRTALLTVRPELAYSAEFWPERDTDAARLLEGIDEGLLDLDSLLPALERVAGDETAAILAKRFLRASDPELARSLLACASGRIASAAADRIVYDEPLLESVLRGDLTPTTLSRLAGSLIRADLNLPCCDAWLTAAVAHDGADFTSHEALRLVLAASSLQAENLEEGLTVASLVLDRTMSDIRRYRLSWAQERWLGNNLPPVPAAWSLRARLAALVVLRWPPRSHDACSLSMVHDRDNVDDLTTAALDRLTNADLTDAMQAENLPLSAAKSISEKLNPSKSKWTIW